MPCEIGLRFDDSGHVVVFLNEDGQIQSAPAQSFTGPLDEKAQSDLKWYLEVYPVQYTTEIDDERAAEIGQRIQGWGEALFDTVFADREAERLFNRFQDERAEGRLLTVSSGHPAVLAQPWELLRDPKGTYLFLDQPRISVRRRLSGSGGGRRPFRGTPKQRLHMLFVVSRPNDAGFIDPRADPQAVMDAIDAEAPGRVTYEFLRPATVGQLIRRLDDKRLAPIDVLHFDGHGVYDSEGGLAERARQAATASGASHVLREAPATEAQQGYLWFENDDGSGAPVAAARLGDLLYQKQVGLIVLSACQSAMVGGEDPMGSVAARLIHAGLPSVLAMTHSVLVDTTRALFGHFYRELARGEPIGTSLDNARSQLYFEAARGERQRADQRITLNLQDWFLPALYQAGADTSLLREAAADVSASASRSNLRPQQESGFHGRRRELWDIERWFVGGTRRVVVSGFGGQGKTFLAEELGRWLPRTGMFSCACFVDYAAFQGSDPVGLAVSTLGTVLGQNLLDADAATSALARTPTLLILDNLEVLDRKALDELLSAAAVWSDAGTSRVLITTRSSDLRHAGFPAKDSNRCRYLVLQGLAPDDALDWFQALTRLPPEPQVPLPQREPLKSLFAKVGFHPLSVGMLARQPKLRRIAELGERLEAFLATEHGDPVLASLNLSLERLDPQSAQWLPRLGVFCGGALEKVLTDICELDEAQWLPLRHGLEQTGLIQAESLPSVATEFLRFHPTLAPALWLKLPASEQERFAAHHRAAYYELSRMLYHGDAKAVAATRQIARRELPNLLAAVHAALDAHDPWAVDFANSVNAILAWLDLRREGILLNERAQAAGGAIGSDDWYLTQSDRGEALLQAGRYREAEKVFNAILALLEGAPHHKRCVTLGLLGRCYEGQSQGTRAQVIYQQALAEAERLEQTEQTRKLIATIQGDLGDVFSDLGRYHEARTAYEASLALKKELGNERGMAVSLAQLGGLALQEGNLGDAESSYRLALDTFRGFGEPSAIAKCWHQLGIVYLGGSLFEEAEGAFRESARIKEEIGDRVGAGGSWAQLAMTLEGANKPNEAEAWYIKALNIFHREGQRAHEGRTLNNLADLLASHPGRLADARALAEQALAIKETQDPAAAEVWTTYSILAEIAQTQGDAEAARAYRLKERASYAAAPVSRHNLRRRGPLIIVIMKAVADPSARAALAPVLAKMAERGWTSFVGALRRILDGECDEDALCASLYHEDSMIVATVLRGIADPATLAELLPAEPDSDQED